MRSEEGPGLYESHDDSLRDSMQRLGIRGVGAMTVPLGVMAAALEVERKGRGGQPQRRAGHSDQPGKQMGHPMIPSGPASSTHPPPSLTWSLPASTPLSQAPLASFE